SPPSPFLFFGWGGGRVGLGGGAADAADARAGVHVQHDVALEHQRAVDHGVGADDDARRALLLPVEGHATGLLHADAALDVRVGAYGDVAGDRLDVAADHGTDDADAAVDVLDAAGHLAAAIQVDAAVDGLDAVDACALAQADAAVHGFQIAGLDVVAALDAAIDGARVLDPRPVADVDAAVDRLQVAVGLPGLCADAAVDLVDVLLREGRRGAGGERDGEGEGEAVAIHGRGPEWKMYGIGCADPGCGLSAGTIGPVPPPASPPCPAPPRPVPPPVPSPWCC